MYLMVTSESKNNSKSSFNTVWDTRGAEGFLRFQNLVWQMVWSEAPHSCSTCLQRAAPLFALPPPPSLAFHYLFVSGHTQHKTFKFRIWFRNIYNWSMHTSLSHPDSVQGANNREHHNCADCITPDMDYLAKEVGPS